MQHNMTAVRMHQGMLRYLMILTLSQQPLALKLTCSLRSSQVITLGLGLGLGSVRLG
jgi:hypothetical protein